MARFKLTLEYEGTSFVGWQRQASLPSVQGQLEACFFDFLGKPVDVWGSGRTDAGVHATGQVAHVDVPKSYSPFAIQGAINKRLRDVPITVLSVEEVPADFHARFSALSRSYEYKILNQRAAPALERHRMWWVIRPLSVEAMTEAASYLLGHQDFSSFRNSQCQASSPFKTLDEFSVERRGNLIVIKARARSFLHNQVRNMVGTLKRVGEGSWPPHKVKEILEAKDRRRAGPTAPPHGLYLTQVCFGEEFSGHHS